MNRYMGEPGKEHWQAMKCILGYLKGTTNIGWIYQCDTSCALIGYLHSNCAVDLDARRSVVRYDSQLVILLSVGKLHFSPKCSYPL